LDFKESGSGLNIQIRTRLTVTVSLVAKLLVLSATLNLHMLKSRVSP